MDFSKTRQKFRLANGGGLVPAPPKDDIDARAGKAENPANHRYRGTEGDGSKSTNPDYPGLTRGSW
jgi:hypothetical protein